MEHILDLFDYLESLPYFQFILPTLLVCAAFLVSKLLRFSLWAVLIAGSLPFFLVYLDLPLAEQFRAQNPALVIGIGWLILLAIGVGLALGRFVLALMNPGASALSFLIFCGVLASVALVALILFDPARLEDAMPGWQSSFGVLILIFSVLAFTMSLVRMLRLGFVLFFWGAICLVIGSEVLLNKLPQDIWMSDLRKLPAFVPEKLIASANERLAKYRASEDLVKVAVLGGTSNVALAIPEKESFPMHLEELLNAGFPERKFEVINASSPGLGMYQLEGIYDEQLQRIQPEVVIISGWYSDAQSNSNSYGIPGLSEIEAQEFVESRRNLAGIPLLAEVYESRLFNVARYMLGYHEPQLTMEARPRLSPEEYGVVLRNLVRKVKDSGAIPVLFHEQIEDSVTIDYEREYERVLRDVARDEGAEFADVGKAFHKHRYDLLFLREQMLSRKGHKVMARALYDTISDMERQEVKNNPRLASVIQELPAFPERALTFVAASENLKEDLIFTLKMDPNTSGYYKVLFSVNGHFVADRRLNIKDTVRVRFKVPEEFLSLPAVKLAVQTVSSNDDAADMIGSTRVCTPRPFEVVSDTSRRPADANAYAIHIPGECRVGRVDSGAHFALVAMDYRNGRILRSASFHESQSDELAQALRTFEWGTLVAISVTQPLESHANDRLRAALRYVGANQFPKAGESYALVGIAGSGEGDAKVEAGAGARRIKLGSEAMYEFGKFQVQEVSTADKKLI